MRTGLLYILKYGQILYKRQPVFQKGLWKMAGGQSNFPSNKATQAKSNIRSEISTKYWDIKNYSALLNFWT